MTSLAERQAALVAALVAGGELPPGFDERKVAVAREALVRKRAGEAAKHWPLLAASLGPQWTVVFGQFAAGRPTAGALRDGWDLARRLARLTEAARAEAPYPGKVLALRRRVGATAEGDRPAGRAPPPGSINVQDHRLHVHGLFTGQVPVVVGPLSGHPLTMDPGRDAGTGAAERPPSYHGRRRLHRTVLGRTGTLVPLMLVAGSVVTVLLVLAVSAMLPSEAAPIPGARAGASGTATGPLSGPASATPGPGPTALTVTNPGVQAGAVGVAVRLQIQATQGISAQRLTWSATGLPKGLKLDPRSGLVTGRPSAAGSSTVTVTVRNSADTSTSVSFVWTVTPTGATGIRNGGFEAGLGPWTCDGGTAVVGTPVHGGGHALGGNPSDANIAQCTQSVAVSPNTHYTLTAWVSGRYAYAGATGPGISDANAWTTTPAGTFSKLTVSFTTGPGTTTASLYVHGWYGQGEYYADDISLASP